MLLARQVSMETAFTWKTGDGHKLWGWNELVFPCSSVIAALTSKLINCKKAHRLSNAPLLQSSTAITKVIIIAMFKSAAVFLISTAGLDARWLTTTSLTNSCSNGGLVLVHSMFGQCFNSSKWAMPVWHAFSWNIPCAVIEWILSSRFIGRTYGVMNFMVYLFPASQWLHECNELVCGHYSPEMRRTFGSDI